MSMKTPLARVLGQGSAKEGVSHWWWQRLTALALIVLGLWFVFSVIGLLGSGYEAAILWLQSPLQATLLILLIAAGFWHAFLGLQVVVEDYIHTEWLKIGMLILLKLFIASAAVVALILVLRINLGS